MSVDDMEHVAYLGAFVVAGKLYRGDLYRDIDGSYWADHSLTEPTGAWMTALHHVIAKDENEAASAALIGMLEYLQLEGHDVTNMTIVHYSPSMDDVSGVTKAAIRFFH